MLVAVLLPLVLLSFALWTPDESRATLEAKYLAAPSDLVDVDGMRLHVRDSGPHGAPAMLFVHGFASSLQTWDDWTPELARAPRVVRLDLPGTGLSDVDPTHDYRDARTVAVLVARMDRLDIRRATLVGHSLGGRIAWTLAAAHPERVDRLVLIAPDGFASPGFGYGRAPKVGVMAQAMRFVLPKPLVRRALAPAYADETALTDERLDRYYDLLRAPGARETWIERMRQGVRVDPVPRLATIRAPTLIVWGTEDRLIPFSNATDYVDAIPRAELAVLPGVGHIRQEEASARSLAAVLGFIDR